jgi:uncharacterized protein DUF4287/activator of Hsp90 ATPase-like protein
MFIASSSLRVGVGVTRPARVAPTQKAEEYYLNLTFLRELKSSTLRSQIHSLSPQIKGWSFTLTEWGIEMATKTKSIKEAEGPRMSDEAVKAKTGKTWKDWFSVLDKAGARKMTHQEIVRFLNSEHDVGPWWQQMVTVTYEQQRGLRGKHEKPDGYQISVSRTLDISLPTLYEAFKNEKKRGTWLSENDLKIRKATANKSLRVNWVDGKTSLEISFLDKGKSKSQVVVQHSRLPDAKAAAKMKSYWGMALDRLRESFAKQE